MVLRCSIKQKSTSNLQDTEELKHHTSYLFHTFPVQSSNKCTCNMQDCSGTKVSALWWNSLYVLKRQYNRKLTFPCTSEIKEFNMSPQREVIKTSTCIYSVFGPTLSLWISNSAQTFRTRRDAEQPIITDTDQFSRHSNTTVCLILAIFGK